MMNKTHEEALRIILQKFDGNDEYKVTGDYSDFPVYVRHSIKDTTETLKALGYIAMPAICLDSWEVTLTPDGISYFEDKKRSAEKGEQMFNKLPSNSKKLLDEILESDNPVNMLCNRFNKCSGQDAEELRSMLRELSNYEYIKVTWASNAPLWVEINNSARTYDERLREYERQFDKQVVKHITYYGDIYGVATAGDIINTTINIDNSIQIIQREIESKGGEDKEALYSLLEEAKSLADEIKETKQIKENPDFSQKITAHMSKHGWFYGAVLGLIGQVALQVISGK